MSEDATYEMMWDCKYCGQKKLLGLTHRFCAGCGGPQDPAARYFPPDDEKVAVHDHPCVGADLTCPACKQPMGRAARCCTNCGSPIDKGAEVSRRDDVVVPDAGGVARANPGAGPPDVGTRAGAPTKKSFPTLLAVLGGLAVVALIGLLVALFWKREGLFVVTGHAWERNINVERYDVGKKTAWCDERPPGGRELSRRKEQRGSTQVKDGETCQTRKKDNGNGTYKEVRECQPKYRSEPVMADRCDFEVTEWRSVRTLAERGASLEDHPHWPALTLTRPGSCLGCEREGARSEKYTVKFSDTKAKVADPSCDLPEARWGTFPKGSRWKGNVRVLTGGVDCDTLARK